LFFSTLFPFFSTLSPYLSTLSLFLSVLSLYLSFFIMTSKSLLQIIKILIFATIIAVPLFFIGDTVYPAVISKTAFFQALVEAAFFLWLALAITDKRYRPRFTSLIMTLVAFVIVIVIVSILGVDPSRSFWSIYGRMFGVVTILHMVALAVVVSSVFDGRGRRRLMYASLATSFVVSAIAIIQTKYQILPALGGAATGINIRSGSTFDNPSFLAGYIIFNIFIGIYLLLDKYRERTDKNRDNVDKYGDKVDKYNLISTLFLFLSIFINVIVVFLTQTRGDILGLGAGVFLLLVFFAARPPRTGGILGGRKFYMVIVMVIVVVCSTFWFTRTSPFWGNVPGLRRFQDVSISLGSAELQPRIIALRLAWRGFLDRPFLGWGPENFNIVFDKYYDPKTLEANYNETRFDKPHNFLMEFLVTGGILLFLSFAALAYFFIRQAWRLKDGPFGQIAIAAFAAYAIQNLFIFDTLGPAMMLYLFIGLVDGEYGGERGVASPNARETSSSNARSGANAGSRGVDKVNAGVVGVFAAVALAIIYFLNVQTTSAAYYEYWGFQYLANGRIQAGIDYFKSTLGVWSPYHYDFAKDYATAMSEAYFYNGNDIPQENVRAAVLEMEKARDAHPLDAYNHYVLVDMYNQVSAIDPSYYLPLAEKEAMIALKLSPNRQEVYFSLAKTKSLEGKNDEAIALVKYALGLDPKVPDAHFYYGLLAFAMGDSKLATMKSKKPSNRVGGGEPFTSRGRWRGSSPTADTWTRP